MDNTMRANFFVILMLATASSAAAKELKYTGVWGLAQTACPKPAYLEEETFVIRKKTMSGLEWSCDIGHISQLSTGWKAKLNCAGEGESWKRVLNWSISKDDQLVQLEGGRKTVYRRCA